jgi:hypothetical protein
MSRFREFTITPEALEQARGLGFTGDVAAQLKELARFAAPFTHSDGNRRNGEWLMLIENGRVLHFDQVREEAEVVKVNRFAQPKAARRQHELSTVGGDAADLFRPTPRPDLDRPEIRVRRKLTPEELEGVLARHRRA